MERSGYFAERSGWLASVERAMDSCTKIIENGKPSFKIQLRLLKVNGRLHFMKFQNKFQNCRNPLSAGDLLSTVSGFSGLSRFRGLSRFPGLSGFLDLAVSWT